MTTQSDYHGDRIIDSLSGQLALLAIVVIGAAAVVTLIYLLW